MKKQRNVNLLLMLVLLVAVGQMAQTIYIPAIADMAKELNVREGAVPTVRVSIATNPSNNDTVTVGGHVFKFVSSLGAANTYTQIKIGGAVATSRATLVKALNGVADSDNIVEGTTTFVAAAAAVEPLL